jgi:ubiquinol-cytochrome c reductase cytochrome c1 subunit
MRTTLTAALLGAALFATPTAAPAAEAGAELMTRNWSFEGIFGSYDDAAAQRGLQVYDQVCSGCHGMKYVAFRTLTDLGYGEEEVEQIASNYFVTDGPNDMGEMFEREAEPNDTWPSPYRNDAEAASIFGKAPPDMSVIAKARPGGADYLYSLLLGYDDEKGMDLSAGNYWNEFYPGHIIAMPPQLYPDLVQYADGTEATPEQMAADVSQFLMWAAEPKLEQRKRLGIGFMLFCTAMALIFYAMNQRLWADIKK